jgi:hypothetical protein
MEEAERMRLEEERLAKAMQRSTFGAKSMPPSTSSRASYAPSALSTSAKKVDGLSRQSIASAPASGGVSTEPLHVRVASGDSDITKREEERLASTIERRMSGKSLNFVVKPVVCFTRFSH